jgi:hypothetical protein
VLVVLLVHRVLLEILAGLLVLQAQQVPKAILEILVVLQVQLGHKGNRVYKVI